MWGACGCANAPLSLCLDFVKTKARRTSVIIPVVSRTVVAPMLRHGLCKDGTRGRATRVSRNTPRKCTSQVGRCAAVVFGDTKSQRYSGAAPPPSEHKIGEKPADVTRLHRNKMLAFFILWLKRDRFQHPWLHGNYGHTHTEPHVVSVIWWSRRERVTKEKRGHQISHSHARMLHA